MTHLHPEAVKTSHIPNHDILQVRTVMHTRDMPEAYTKAKRAAQVLRQALKVAKNEPSTHLARIFHSCSLWDKLVLHIHNLLLVKFNIVRHLFQFIAKC